MSNMRFLRVSEVIERLRDTVSGIEKRVGGADDAGDTEDKGKLDLPCLYVTLASGSASSTTKQTGMQQTLTHGFQIILHIDKTDRRGQYATELVVNMKMALLVALNGWLPDVSLSSSESVNCNATVLGYVNDGLLDDDGADFFWAFNFEHEYDFDSSEDALGMLGDYADLNDFDALDLDIVINPDVDVEDVKIELTGVHE